MSNRHTFATMMIAGGTDVRTVARYLGNSSVSMTLNTYADVDPDAKLQAVGKIEDSFDIDMAGICGDPLSAPCPVAADPGRHLHRRAAGGDAGASQAGRRSPVIPASLAICRRGSL